VKFTQIHLEIEASHFWKKKSAKRDVCLFLYYYTLHYHLYC